MPMEKIVFISIPKGGTYVLLRYFDLIGYQCIGPFEEINNDPFSQYIEPLKIGECRPWHYHWSQDRSDLVNRIGAKVVFLYRDPRAQMCSNLHYIMDTPQHPLHKMFKYHLWSDRERILRLINGLTDKEYEVFLEASPSLHDHQLLRNRSGINNLYGFYVGWLEDPAVFKVRFEDIIGPSGGGDRGIQMHVIGELMHFTGVKDDSLGPAVLASQLFYTKAATFRKGWIDSWREELWSEFQEEFARKNKDLLELWGYELT